jgi:hypothetical protein
MSAIVSHKTLTPDALLNLASPVILCAGWKTYEQAISAAGYQTISLNLPLAKALVGKTETEITMVITATVIGLLPKNTPIYLTDYEMLFDPRYRLNVMKLFCEISRHNKLLVKWCGGIFKYLLSYSEEGYEDYHRYDVYDYEVTCVS